MSYRGQWRSRYAFESGVGSFYEWKFLSSFIDPEFQNSSRTIRYRDFLLEIVRISLMFAGRWLGNAILFAAFACLLSDLKLPCIICQPDQIQAWCVCVLPVSVRFVSAQFVHFRNRSEVFSWVEKGLVWVDQTAAHRTI